MSCKPDGSPLTAADLDAHRVIAGGLADLDGSIPLISEEDVRQVDMFDSELFWLVDPLDGHPGVLEGRWTVYG